MVRNPKWSLSLPAVAILLPLPRRFRLAGWAAGLLSLSEILRDGAERAAAKIFIKVLLIRLAPLAA